MDLGHGVLWALVGFLMLFDSPLNGKQQIHVNPPCPNGADGLVIATMKDIKPMMTTCGDEHVNWIIYQTSRKEVVEMRMGIYACEDNPEDERSVICTAENGDKHVWLRQTPKNAA